MSGTNLLSSGPLVLVNREHPLFAEPKSEELVSLRSGVRLNARAAVMLEQLFKAVHGEGALVPVSGYRSRDEQKAIWDDALLEHGQTFTETYVAPPGCSEHQTGLAVDLGENRPDIDFLCPEFPDTGICRLFRLRCADYGFILRYPKGKEAVTGIGWEPWHFRYVGWPHAKIMMDRDMTLEEYTDWLRGFPEDGTHLWYQSAGRAFELCHVPAARLPGQEDRFPTGLPLQCSGNNVDGAVVTIWRDAG